MQPVNRSANLPPPSGTDPRSLHTFHQQTIAAVNSTLDSFGTRLNQVLPKDGSEPLTGALTLGAFTTAALPAAASHSGAIVYVTDASAGQRFQISDGTNWKPVPRFTGNFTSGHLVSIAADGSLQDSGGTGSSGTVTNVSDATNGGISVINSTTTPTLALKPSDLLTKTVPLTTDSFLMMDAAASNAAKTSTLAELQTAIVTGAPGTMTKGTSCIQNPVATNTVTTTAHGLGAYPNYFEAYIECLTANANYPVGKRIHIGDLSFGGLRGIEVAYDATNVSIVTSVNTPAVLDFSTGSPAAITLADWKVVVVPYVIH